MKKKRGKKNNNKKQTNTEDHIEKKVHKNVGERRITFIYLFKICPFIIVPVKCIFFPKRGNDIF